MNDIQIINGLKNGNEAAFHYAINKYSKLMWSIASTVLANTAADEDIEECVADVFVYLWQNHEKYDAQRGRLKSWLSAIVKSKAINKYHQLSKRSELSLNDEIVINEIAVIDDVMTAETKSELIAAVNALEDPDREIIIRRYLLSAETKRNRLYT